MSFLNSVLTSIGTGDATITPPPAHVKAKSEPTPSLSTKAPSTQRNGSSLYQKHTAEHDVLRPISKLNKVTKPSATVRSTLHSKPPTPTSTTQPPFKTKPTAPSTAKPTAPSQRLVAPAPSKPPPKGSFADIMAQAKALQQQKPLSVGVIKHQTVVKERMSKPKRERLLKEAKQREIEANKVKKTTSARSSPNAGGRFRDEKMQSRKERSEPGYRGTARPSAAPAYTGTGGLSSRRGTSAPTQDRRKSKHPSSRIRDEYLGTDEEDEGEYSYGGDDYYDDYSDASSDMEAGAMDLEEEEQTALRFAKAEDERELKAEMEAKKAKLDRKKKLVALSKSRR
ncbi:hypothetical protein LOZ66_001273 [Ophidiomyces ophidiicola]|nr:hypothetical protein LOZ66_001273 [Ophidiomyces ophidiicola]